MHPLARVFQIVFLVGGIFFLAIGYAIYYDDFQQTTTVDISWDCTVEDGEQKCETVNGRLDSGSIGEAQVNMFAGAVLMLASGAVSIGGRRREQKGPAAPPAMGVGVQTPGGVGSPQPGGMGMGAVPPGSPAAPPQGPPPGPPRF